MTKEACDEEEHNVGIVGVRRDHSHEWDEVEAELRRCQRWINWSAEMVEKERERDDGVERVWKILVVWEWKK